MSKKIGLVLSGGGARGIAHIGVLIALEEMGIRPAVIAGTSAGAIAAAYYAAGLSPREMLEIVKSTGFVSLFRPTLLSAGFINSHRIARTHLQYLPATFAELKIPIYVTATNINVGKPKHFHEGDLVKAVNASLALPIMFAPVEIDGYQYLDGGIMNNFPVEPLVEHENCDILIGVDVNAINYMEDVSSKLSVMERVFFMAINSHASARKKAVDILIVPPDMGHFGFFDVGKANQMVEAGYQATRTILAEYDGLVVSE